MSHQTGIKCCDELKDVFRDCTTTGNIRCVKVSIEEETLVCSTCIDKTSDSWEDEYDNVILKLLTDKQPTYLIYQLASKNNWLLITYSPDKAHIRQKMLYAATRATLKSEFGGGFVQDEMFGNTKADLSYKGYMEYLTHKNAPPPLTNTEEEMKIMEENESKSAFGSSTRHQTVQGVEFPITEDAKQAIKDFKEGTVNHVELKINLKDEEIYQSSSRTISASDLESLISKDGAGYHLFNYAHRFDGEDISSIFFIYSMPGHTIPIKARMLYSSCKAPLLSTIEDVYKIALDRKLECDSSEVVNEAFMRNEMHPPDVDKRQNFNKPKAPGRRAPTRKPKRVDNDTE